MSSEHPPEEAELHRPVGYTCLHCEGWGCRRCVPVGGEQSLGVDELREVALRNRVRELERQLGAMAAERDRFAHENTGLRRSVDGLKQTLSGLTKGAKR